MPPQCRIAETPPATSAVRRSVSPSSAGWISKGSPGGAIRSVGRTARPACSKRSTTRRPISPAAPVTSTGPSLFIARPRLDMLRRGDRKLRLHGRQARGHRMRFRSGLAIAALLLGMAPAAAQSLRIGLQEDPDALDPMAGTSFVGRIVFAALCDKLVDLDPKLTYVPQLATAWEWGEAGRTLTMTLREGVVFHDGEPLDAEAVRFNIDRYRTTPGSRRAAELRPVQAVEVLGPLTSPLPHGAALRPPARRAVRPGRDDAVAEGGAGGGCARCRRSGLRRALPLRPPRGAGPHRAGEVRRLLERAAPSSWTAGGLPADPGDECAPGQPAMRRARPDGAHRPDRPRRRCAPSAACASSRASRSATTPCRSTSRTAPAAAARSATPRCGRRSRPRSTARR